jgi:predicted transcriptional regulator
VGSVSEKSVLAQIVKGRPVSDISERPVSEIMEEAFPIVDEESDFLVLSSLLQFGPAVLLTKKGLLTGIVTKADLLKVIEKVDSKK